MKTHCVYMCGVSRKVPRVRSRPATVPDVRATRDRGIRDCMCFTIPGRIFQISTVTVGVRGAALDGLLTECNTGPTSEVPPDSYVTEVRSASATQTTSPAKSLVIEIEPALPSRISRFFFA